MRVKTIQDAAQQRKTILTAGISIGVERVAGRCSRRVDVRLSAHRYDANGLFGRWIDDEGCSFEEGLRSWGCETNQPSAELPE